MQLEQLMSIFLSYHPFVILQFSAIMTITPVVMKKDEGNPGNGTNDSPVFETFITS